jgi:hypothetical protein
VFVCGFKLNYTAENCNWNFAIILQNVTGKEELERLPNFLIYKFRISDIPISNFFGSGRPTLQFSIEYFNKLLSLQQVMCD